MTKLVGRCLGHVLFKWYAALLVFPCRKNGFLSADEIVLAEYTLIKTAAIAENGSNAVCGVSLERGRMKKCFVSHEVPR